MRRGRFAPRLNTNPAAGGPMPGGRMPGATAGALEAYSPQTQQQAASAMAGSPAPMPSSPEPTPMSLQAKMQSMRGNLGMAAGPAPGAVSSAPKRTPPSLYGTPMSGAMKKGGKVTASRRADGIAQRGKTKGRFV